MQKRFPFIFVWVNRINDNTEYLLEVLNTFNGKSMYLFNVMQNLSNEEFT